MDDARALPVGHRDFGEPVHLVGGAEAPRTVAGFRKCDRLHKNQNGSGFVLTLSSIDDEVFGNL